MSDEISRIVPLYGYGVTCQNFVSNFPVHSLYVSRVLQHEYTLYDIADASQYTLDLLQRAARLGASERKQWLIAVHIHTSLRTSNVPGPKVVRVWV